MWNPSDKELRSLVDEMTDAEKVDLMNGRGLWRTSANYRLNVPEIIMTDGTYGVRYSVSEIDEAYDEKTSLERFLSVVNQRADKVLSADFNSTRPATCYPNGSAFGCAWDVNLAYELGSALAAECQAYGVNLLLGPGINIRRTPLGGRSYEYYSEDPVLAGDVAASVIRGLQENGVGASLKHFACNNSEIRRTTMSSDVGERALREIYLAGFERAIRKGKPWTVMSSYNRLNGVQAAENHWLLTRVLREDWSYDGVVVSDWHGIKNRAAAAVAGNDLDMPESKSRKRQLLAAMSDGSVPMAVIDKSCLRILELVRRAKKGERRDATFDPDRHHELARRMAAESIVLLKNEGQLLPLRPALKRIAVIGNAAVEPVIQGSGCATTRPTRLDIPFDHIKALAGASAEVGHFPLQGAEPEANAGLAAAAIHAAANADVVIIFGNTDIAYDGEGTDRADLHLAGQQDALIEEVARINPRTVVVLASPDAVEMPWLTQVPAVLSTFFAGQGMGSAVADILFGRSNPSGKLTVTFPARLEDTPAFLSYPGENDHHSYAEGIFVGYRFYDRRQFAPLFPFGFGLSYTTFAYSDLRLDRDTLREDDTLTVSFAVTNTGSMGGQEVCQIYGAARRARLQRPVRELKGFAKVQLEPGETKRVEVPIATRDLRYFDPAHQRWLLDAGRYAIEVGASSRDIRLSAEVTCEASRLPAQRFTIDSQPFLILDDLVGREKLHAFFRSRLELDDHGAGHLINYCRTSFVGIYSTIAWFAGEVIAEDEVRGLIDDINRTNRPPPEVKAA